MVGEAGKQLTLKSLANWLPHLFLWLLKSLRNFMPLPHLFREGNPANFSMECAPLIH